MNPTEAAVTAIIDQISDWGAADEAIVAELNEPTVPNPEPQGVVLPTLSIEGLVGILSQQSIGNLWGSPNAQAVRDAVQQQDRPGVAAWIGIALAAEAITPEEHAALTAAIQATMPDPSWRSHLSWAEVNIGREVDTDDIRTARMAVELALEPEVDDGGE